MNRFLLGSAAFLICTIGYSQIINGYAEVTLLSGTTLTLASVDESGDTFEDGEFVLIMQMQDSVIGNVSDAASFGSLGMIRSAGLYEIRAISSHTESAGIPTSLTLTSAPNNTYFTGANRRVQVITFPTLGSPDYTTTGNLSAKIWNGTTGGVLCFNVTNVLTLAHNLSANASGFLGAAADVDATCGGTVCEDLVFISTRTTRGYKGEGIFRNANANYEAARGRMLNGGGGGACHNGGGGGGGNYTAGGDGGLGYGCTAVSPRSAGGLGGLSLAADISASRIFMGGGGGSGERNNGFNNGGGNGGGIIIIKADEIRTSGSCGGLTISTNGGTAPNVGNDGAGGGGAGGSIIIEVNTWAIVATCPVTVSSNGGNGGRTNDGSTHAGGGGGGQGVIIFSIATPSANTTLQTNNGTGGCNNNSNPCNSQAGSGAGANNSGVVGGLSGPLPIALLEFAAQTNGDRSVDIRWSTASEINNDYFNVMRSGDGLSWTSIVTVKGAANSNKINHYSVKDEYPLYGWSYYQLKQTDFDGTVFLSEIVTINRNNSSTISIYPNPGKDRIIVEKENIASDLITVYTALGEKIHLESEYNESRLILHTSELAPGIYFLKISGNNQILTGKLIIN